MPSPCERETSAAATARRLGAWQRAMQAALLEPRDKRAAAPENLRGERAATLVAGSERRSADEGLEIYRGMIARRFQGVLAATFPATRAALGDEEFRRAVERYLAASPSRSFTLGHLGRGFAVSLRQEARPAWIAELAGLEWAIDQVGDEPAAAVTAPATPAERSPEEWAATTFAAARAVQLCRLEYPVVGQRNVLLEGGTPETAPSKEPQAALAYRKAGGASVLAMTPLEGRLFAALLAGATLGDALEATFAEHAEIDTEELFTWLHRWFEKNLLRTIEPTVA